MAEVVNLASGEDEKTLHSAAKKNNWTEIKRLLSLGADVNAKDKFGRTPLNQAAFFNTNNSHFESIDLLLKNGADVNTRDIYESTPLHNLVREADIEAVELFLNFGADVNLINDYSRTPLFNAIPSGNFEVVKLLVDRGSKIEAATDINGFTPLTVAAIHNQGESHFNIAELLLKNGADVNQQIRDGNTPVHCLVDQSNAKTLQLLLDFGADVNIKNHKGEIPLFCAIKNKNVEVVKLLLDNGSDINSVKNEDGSTLLHEACMSRCSVEIIKILLKKGLDVNTANRYGLTPFVIFLIWSSDLPDPASLTALLKYADVNYVDSREQTILCIKNQEVTWKILLKHIAKLQALDIYLRPSILESISKNEKQKSYFEKCTKELTEAKCTKLQDCWVTFFNLLLDRKRKLKNYAGNQDLVKQFEKSDCKNKFPIYGALMVKNVIKGMRIRRLFDDSAEVLSDCLPCFSPTHLIIRDTLDCFKTKDLLKLCENY